MTEHMTYTEKELDLEEEAQPVEQALSPADVAVEPFPDEGAEASVGVVELDVQDAPAVEVAEAPVQSPDDTESWEKQPATRGKPVQSGLRPGLRAGLSL